MTPVELSGENVEENCPFPTNPLTGTDPVLCPKGAAGSKVPKRPAALGFWHVPGSDCCRESPLSPHQCSCPWQAVAVALWPGSVAGGGLPCPGWAGTSAARPPSALGSGEGGLMAAAPWTAGNAPQRLQPRGGGGWHRLGRPQRDVPRARPWPAWLWRALLPQVPPALAPRGQARGRAVGHTLAAPGTPLRPGIPGAVGDLWAPGRVRRAFPAGHLLPGAASLPGAEQQPPVPGGRRGGEGGGGKGTARARRGSEPNSPSPPGGGLHSRRSQPLASPGQGRSILRAARQRRGCEAPRPHPAPPRCSPGGVLRRGWA